MQDLRDTFIKHDLELQHRRTEMKDKFNEDFPGEPLPEYFREDFSLSLALASICDEIIQLKKGNT